MKLTHDRLIEVLHYEPHKGVFTWRKRLSNRVVNGTQAGVIERNGYRLIRIDSVLYKASRLAWFYVNKQWPSVLIDHIDGNRANDSISNLRLATDNQNAQNRPKSKNNTSGYKGVYLDKRRGMWVASIMCRRRKHHLGQFASAQLAHNAYAEAARRLHGEYAKVN